jgi:hypothetical protein
MRRVRTVLFVIWILTGMLFIDYDLSTALAAQKNGMMVTVTQAGQVLDSITYQGITVDAIYTNEAHSGSDPTYSCAAFVKKFYKSVYGIGVYNLNSSSSTPLIYENKGSFLVTDTPQVGDIVRDNQRTHWAIVKEISEDTITIIQQNYQSGVTAWVGCSVDRKDPGYTFFTYSERVQEEPTVLESVLEPALEPKIIDTEKILYIGCQDYRIQFEQLKEDSQVFYSFDQPEVVMISSDGVVIPLQKGEVTLDINIIQDNINYTLQMKIIVKEPYIKLSSSKKELKVGDSMKIKVKKYGTEEEPIWQLSDPTIASINEKTGKLSAKKKGTVTVIGRTESGLSATLKIKVK